MPFFNFRRKRSVSDPQNARNFFDALPAIATRAGRGDWAFDNGAGERLGFAQFIPESPTQIIIHRLWTKSPGKGNGSAVLKKVCALADQHGVELLLETIPIGRKPHPMSREELAAWYGRYGFVKAGKKMSRKPRAS